MRVETVPEGTDVVLLAVRADNIDASVQALLASAPGAPVVSLTPLFPEELDKARAWLGDRLVPALPSLASYVDGNVVRYWLARVPPTLVDEEGARDPAVCDLIRALRAAGIRTKPASQVASRNLALTVAFLPVVLLLHASGGRMDEAVRDRDRLVTTGRAVRASVQLARRLGPLPAASHVLARASTPSAIRSTVWSLERVQPELLRYLEAHFGHKTRQQNRILGRQLVAMGKRERIGVGSVESLLAQCEFRDAASG